MNGWDRMEKRAEKGPMSAFWAFFIPIFSIFVILGIVGFATGIISLPFRGAAKVLERTFDGDNMITQYEWFKRQHEDFYAIGEKADQAKAAVEDFEKSAGDRKDWDRYDKEEHARLKSIHAGLEMQQEDVRKEYNARSRMVNRSIFKTGDTELPDRL